MNKINVIYLMGTGRSGTTALATILGNHHDILTVGEVNQFYNEIDSASFTDKSYWNKIKESLVYQDLSTIDNEIYALERHNNILKYLMRFWPSKMPEYQKHQSEMFKLIENENKSAFYLDSSKYVARALLLSKNKNINLKIINLTRDPRGVIWSFRKKVQTTNSPFKTIIYYYVISIFSQLAIWFYFSRNTVLQLRYEDLTNSTQKSFKKLSNFLNLDLRELQYKIQKKKEFKVPEIIGGNRLKSNKSIVINPDIEWKSKTGFWRKITYYIVTLPLNIFYRYKF
jgi:hypothetical protein